VPILAVRPASRRLSTKVRIFIGHLEKTFALCSSLTRDPANLCARMVGHRVTNLKLHLVRKSSTDEMRVCRTHSKGQVQWLKWGRDR